jgi:di/tricarboxylate transporter
VIPAWEIWATGLVVLVVLLALWQNVAGPDVLLTGGALALVTLSIFSPAFPSPTQFAANFGNEGVLTVGALFVVAAGLTETGGMSLLTERMLGRPRGESVAVARLMVPVTAMSAFLNNTPLVAMFIPLVTEWSKKIGISASKLLMPLSYAAILGGLTTLIGTSTNLVVQALLVEANKTNAAIEPMRLFTLTPVGVPVAITGVLFVVLASRWLLPSRTAFLAHVADTRQYTAEMQVAVRSSIDGVTIEAAGLRNLPGLYLSAIERQGELLAAVGSSQVIRGGDRLVFVGRVESVAELQRIRGLVPATVEMAQTTASQLNRLLVEAVVSGTSPLIGRTIRDGQFRTRYDAAVIAVYRNGAHQRGKIGDIVLEAGDTLLLQAHGDFVARHRNDRDFLLVAQVEGTRPVRHHRAGVAVAILIGIVLAAALENITSISIFHASLVGAALMGLSGCLSAQQARRSIDLSILLSIVAALTIGQAMERSGLASLAGAFLTALNRFGPMAVLAGLYLVTLIITELVTNNAAVALAFPIAKAAAVDMGVDFLPFVVVVCIAGSAGFATPMGYQTHLMVYGPGGYRFSDFIRFGIPLDIICMVVTLLVTSFVYPF